MKTKFLLLVALLCSVGVSAQVDITDKGYFFSADGFTCKNGNLYTADLRTMVRAGYAEVNIDDPYDYQYYAYTSIIEVPSGAEIIPSNLVYSPTGMRYASSSTTEMRACRYIIIIPSSVHFIATDAFMMPNVLFYTGESSVQTLSTDNNVKEVARFNLNGQRLREPQEGINIVLMDDGTARKVLVQ